MKNPKKFSALTVVAGLVAATLAAVAAPASAESGKNFAKRTATYTMGRTISDAGVVVVHPNENIHVTFEGELTSAARSGLTNNDVLNLLPGVTKTGTFTYSSVYVSINTSWSGGNGIDSRNGDETASASVTLGGAPSYANFFVSLTAYATTEGTITLAPVIKKGTTAYSISTDVTNIERVANRSVMATVANSVTAKAEDTSLNYHFPGICVATSTLTAGDTLTLTASLSNGSATNLGTVSYYSWGKLQPDGMPSNTGNASTYTVPAFTSGDLIQIASDVTLDSVTPGTTYSVAEYKVTKGGNELSLVGCGTTNVGLSSSNSANSYLTVVLDTSTDTKNMGGMTTNKFGTYVCSLYATSDTSHNTVIASGLGYGMPSGNSMVWNSVSCGIFGAPAGTYTVGVRGLAYSYSSDEKFLSGTVTVGAAKVNPTFPKLATKVKKGKTITLALSSTLGTKTAGKTTQGLVAKAVSATSKICSVTAAKNSKKKITGYTVKGLKAGTCKVTVTITGNTSYNTQSKTLSVAVS